MSCKSISRFKGKICELTRRNKPGKYSEIIARLNRMLIGWTNYYRYIRSESKLKELDSWIRRKLRVIKLKQLKRCYTVAKFYMRNGVKKYQAWIGALSGKGYWRRSAIPQSHQSMNLQWFKEQGLVSLSKRWQVLQTKP
ncbi:MAG: hypothetical protein JEZ07_19440 [Phycisphaerae bacterium]|nr:hypothetical protein [Phycisphaerae bacterium]